MTINQPIGARNRQKLTNHRRGKNDPNVSEQWSSQVIVTDPHRRA